MSAVLTRPMQTGVWSWSMTWAISPKVEYYSLMALFIALLCSSFTVIYLKYANRKVISQLQYYQQQTYDLKLEQSQLFLELGTWADPARIQYIAKTQCHMQFLHERHRVLVPL